MSAQPFLAEPPVASPQPADDHVFLIGRPPVAELIAFMRTKAIEGQARNLGELTEAWRRANDHVRRLEVEEAGRADLPPIRPLPAELQEQRLRLLNDPIVQRAYQSMPWDVVMVELDRLVVYQKSIDLTHVARIRSQLPEHPSPRELFELCLPAHRENPPARVMQTTPNSFAFLSPSNDFRFLQTDLLSGDDVQDWSAIGPVTSVLGLVLGYGSNCLTALSAGGRLILGNGSHRSYALREHGITHVPCIVQKVSRQDELELVAPPELVHHSERYLRAARPPLLEDYFDPALRMIVPVARKNRMVRVTYSIETVDLPA